MELGLEYEFHPIRSRTGETLSAEFLRLNPRHKIPVLRHGTFVLTESAAIVKYLSETFAKPDQFYVPTDAMSRAKLNEWCYFIMCELDAGSLDVSTTPPAGPRCRAIRWTWSLDTATVGDRSIT